VGLARASNRATKLLKCPSCRGTWLPSDEARINAVSDLMEADDTLKPGAAEDMRTGLCPLGHGILIRAKVDLEDPFYLDRCPECAGIWFDSGEWNTLAQSHLLANIEDLWDPALRWRAQKERAEDAFRDKLEEAIGAEAFASLVDLSERLRSTPAKARLAVLAFLRERIEM
jgi:Zn-finger nucleic acid-binding protein